MFGITTTNVYWNSVSQVGRGLKTLAGSTEQQCLICCDASLKWECCYLQSANSRVSIPLTIY